MTVHCSRCGVETDEPRIVFEKLAYTTAQLAAVVGLTPQAVRWHVRIGLLNARVPGQGRVPGNRKVIVLAEDAYAWLDVRDDWEELAQSMARSRFGNRYPTVPTRRRRRGFGRW